MRQHLFVKYVKTKLSFGPNGRKIVKIYHRDKIKATAKLGHLHRTLKKYIL